MIVKFYKKSQYKSFDDELLVEKNISILPRVGERVVIGSRKFVVDSIEFIVNNLCYKITLKNDKTN